jgi:hypothetical protein
MSRLTLALAFWLSFLSVASASLSPCKEFSGLSPVASRAPTLDRRDRQTIASEFVVTDRTEILLDGRPCSYALIPVNATIERMEVESDKKTVLKVYFRVQK